ncbi:seryl-tRNA synthetase [Saccharomonospora amisosensis]|uniref:Serine--tRNA ligase n=1 Tax=Saccharomonospora amisosensis TaxID=1128677 RepID=A0A7X5UMV1_9PSEU|nr:serine--tRNA ligase [Saccharomonospora amisosensis]NIJ10498.1 seryl-tRNA synthetase [Saccharomonospora amisosensis]
MIDLDLLLNHTDSVAERLAGKKVDRSLVLSARDAVLDRRAINAKLDTKRAEMNRRSKDFGRLMAQNAANVDEERAALAELKTDIADLEEQLRKAIETADELLYQLPNLPHPAVPVGLEEEDNVILRYEGPEASQRTDTRPHWEIADELGLLDLKRAAKLSGSGFPVLYGDGSRLLRALVQFALDLHRDRYLELVVPHFVRRETPMATGHLPKFADDMYNTTLDDLWAVPTGELPLTGLHRDEILSVEDLPKRYMTYTACFRREAGSAGKDTRGMQRLHEFHKVELVQLCHPDEVEDQFFELLADCERALQLLELPYRVVDLCTGDLTFSSARIYDLEVYAPGLDKWLECSSVGNFTDFQARRGGIRYRRPEGGTAPVNTLNGSAIATPRVWSAILEHGLQPDGTVRVPDVLVPYVGKDTLTRDERAPRS